jgi:hypothetical protein
VRTDSLDTGSGFFTISDAPHAIELDWGAASAPGANDGFATLWIDGVQQQAITGIDNDTFQIDNDQMGAVKGIDSGAAVQDGQYDAASELGAPDSGNRRIIAIWIYYPLSVWFLPGKACSGGFRCALIVFLTRNNQEQFTTCRCEWGSWHLLYVFFCWPAVRAAGRSPLQSPQAHRSPIQATR